MFTSRAEYRLHLRVDNADRRLTRRGIEVGCVGDRRRRHFEAKVQRVDAARERLCRLSVTPDAALAAGIRLSRDGVARTALEVLSMPTASPEDLLHLWPDLADIDGHIFEQLANDGRYAPYAERQARDIAAMRQNQSCALPADMAYAAIAGLSGELRAKLTAARPADLAQAARIDGMTPAALGLLLAHARRAAAPSVA